MWRLIQNFENLFERREIPTMALWIVSGWVSDPRHGLFAGVVGY